MTIAETRACLVQLGFTRAELDRWWPLPRRRRGNVVWLRR